MDIANTWRRLHPGTADAPRAGVSDPSPDEGITITDVAQQCQPSVPAAALAADEVTVTVTSNRPGVAAQVSVGANLNSPDGTYQGPTISVGHGEFTATDSQVQVSFVVLPTAGWPVLGVGAEAVWADGTDNSVTLTYAEIACHPVWWGGWLIRIVATLEGAFMRRRIR
jgi:hypothetical protein